MQPLDRPRHARRDPAREVLEPAPRGIAPKQCLESHRRAPQNLGQRHGLGGGVLDEGGVGVDRLQIDRDRQRVPRTVEDRAAPGGERHRPLTLVQRQAIVGVPFDDLQDHEPAPQSTEAGHDHDESRCEAARRAGAGHGEGSHAHGPRSDKPWEGLEEGEALEGTSRADGCTAR
jgi:hypothetical protein